VGFEDLLAPCGTVTLWGPELGSQWASPSGKELLSHHWAEPGRPWAVAGGAGGVKGSRICFSIYNMRWAGLKSGL
jgi:hypothetical protein